MNQKTQCEFEPQAVETTILITTINSKARATYLTNYKITGNISEKKTLFMILKGKLKQGQDFIENLL